jgi:cytochrome c biogenesis protein CcmG/thiol:disulfide interchange protein DsbE
MISNLVRTAALLLAVSLAVGSGAARTPRPGDTAPSFTLTLLDGTKVSLTDLKGKVVILNLWATWCGPCRQEMPALHMMQANGGKYGLQVYGVVTNDSPTVKRLKAYADIVGYPLAHRMQGGYEAIRGQIPTNYVIDRKGVVRYAKAGSLSPEQFGEIIVPLLNEKP